MNASTPQALLFYDGTCGFCHWVVRFVLARDRRGVFRFASLAGVPAVEALAPFGGVPADPTTFYLLVPGPALLARSHAALAVAGLLGWPWRVAGILRVLPVAWLDTGYDLVARHRHALFGRRDTCFVPRPEDRARFLDSESAP